MKCSDLYRLVECGFSGGGGGYSVIFYLFGFKTLKYIVVCLCVCVCFFFFFFFCVCVFFFVFFFWGGGGVEKITIFGAIYGVFGGGVDFIWDNLYGLFKSITDTCVLK